MRPTIMLYLDDHRGIYIPRDFATVTKRECVTGVDESDLDILRAGPDHDLYWDSWDMVCRDARVTDPRTGVVYTLYQDGALWLVPEGMEWCDKTESYEWPETDEEG